MLVIFRPRIPTITLTSRSPWGAIGSTLASSMLILAPSRSNAVHCTRPPGQITDPLFVMVTSALA